MCGSGQTPVKHTITQQFCISECSLVSEERGQMAHVSVWDGWRAVADDEHQDASAEEEQHCKVQVMEAAHQRGAV